MAHCCCPPRTRTMKARELTDRKATALNDGLPSEEEVFVETCTLQLVSTAEEGSISQVSFSAFLTRYCHDAGSAGSVTRGPACSDVLLLFQDLPMALQLAFVEAMSDDTCAQFGTVQLPQCLLELNSGGELFYVPTTATFNICSASFDLMLSTDLLAVHSALPVSYPTTSPTLGAEHGNVVPSASPIQGTLSPPVLSSVVRPDPSYNGNTARGRTMEVSVVIGLGIAMSVLFALAISANLVRRFLCAKPTKKATTSTEFALLGDESVSSENSHAAVPEETTLPHVLSADDSSQASSTGSWFPKSSTPKSATVTTATTSNDERHGQRSTVRAASKNHAKRSHSMGNYRTTPRNSYSTNGTLGGKTRKAKRRSSFPQALVTENLSDDNPVHIRRRFSHGRSSSSSFTFEESEWSNRLARRDPDGKVCRAGTTPSPAHALSRTVVPVVPADKENVTRSSKTMGDAAFKAAVGGKSLALGQHRGNAVERSAIQHSNVVETN
jgi:hypothetical protein